MPDDPHPLRAVLPILSAAVLLVAGTAAALCGEGAGPAPPREAAPHGPPTPAPSGGGGDGPKEREWTPRPVDWLDTGGEVPGTWGWGGRVLLTWLGQGQGLEVTPLAVGTVELRMENLGSGTADIPIIAGPLSRSFWTIDVTYEGEVDVPWGDDGTVCFPPRDTFPLTAGEARTVKACVTGVIDPRLPGRYRITSSRPTGGEEGTPPRRCRVLPDLEVRILRATNEDIGGIVARLGKRASWKDIRAEECGTWGDLGDARLLPPLEGLVGELQEALARDPKGPLDTLRSARFAMARIKVLLALDGGRDDEVRAFLQAEHPDDHRQGHFKAMLRARMKALRAPR